MMKKKIILGWSRDQKGKVVNRHPVKSVNCLTTFTGGSFGTAVQYVLECDYEETDNN
ncbi:MAG: hypothetical protein KBT34_02995 [Prevotella sp.]|nr:hypothetical protein [Candidatus Prevotella equi]